MAVALWCLWATLLKSHVGPKHSPSVASQMYISTFWAGMIGDVPQWWDNGGLTSWTCTTSDSCMLWAGSVVLLDAYIVFYIFPNRVGKAIHCLQIEGDWSSPVHRERNLSEHWVKYEHNGLVNAVSELWLVISCVLRVVCCARCDFEGFCNFECAILLFFVVL